MKFRKKPVVIEAEQYRADQVIGIPRGVCFCAIEPRAHLHTMHEGQLVVLADGDWIMPEPDGAHFYPCKPEVFAATYEAVVE